MDEVEVVALNGVGVTVATAVMAAAAAEVVEEEVVQDGIVLGMMFEMV